MLSATAIISILHVRICGHKHSNPVFLATDVETILNWKETSPKDVEIPFKPSRVLLQDFTGVPAVVDLAAMRTAM